MNKFYAYYVESKGYIRVTKTLRIKTTKNIAEIVYWTNKREAKSWFKYLKLSYPNAQLVEMVLTLKADFYI